MCDQTREKASWANDLVIYKNGIEVISLAVKCCNDDISVSMMTRILDHIMRFGEAGEKRAVPLALSLLYVSNPSVAIIETLAKYSHDIDQDVVLSSIIAMGIVGAGTNNARLSSQLKNLASHCGSPKNNNYLFAVRIAQCFLFMGKGTLSLSPFVCDRFICKKAVLVAVIGFLISFLDSSKSN
ncbi:26S proteasome non-ATPase regulatory subunit 2-like [Octopus sinensis]|uniref:26S proteasome non-ATPase regulatory subunit 2-like n=1 Tax=Octopus sinensis TaxID=2607531 RepID=A0A6P7U0D4_9MOLL|nr:26S proteasome non-ATPase regulatory subunit 2-like [Octopus sinensis]